MTSAGNTHDEDSMGVDAVSRKGKGKEKSGKGKKGGKKAVKWEDQSDCKTEEHELLIDSGGFGHVCPPWFAPQFQMVSSTNVEAVAANNVALQHCGQKVFYGHVMTNSGRRILVQTTLDVMSVRKPLLSTSALLH